MCRHALHNIPSLCDAYVVIVRGVRPWPCAFDDIDTVSKLAPTLQTQLGHNLAPVCVRICDLVPGGSGLTNDHGHVHTRENHTNKSWAKVYDAVAEDKCVSNGVKRKTVFGLTARAKASACIA